MSRIEQQLYREPGENLPMVIVKPRDQIRDTIEAYSIPGEVFNSVVKMIISSDASDARQKRKRAAPTEEVHMEKLTRALETQKFDHATAKSGYNAVHVRLLANLAPESQLILIWAQIAFRA